MNLADKEARQRALDPNQSYIVQAPAGSGKTEILVQRFLVLLAQVEQPEAIIALTFTRKAAHEMQQRILQAMTKVITNESPTTPHQQLTWELAQRALTHSEKLGWDLLRCPQRLRIQTIDSLCHYLVRQMPILSGCGAQPTICTQPIPYYKQAIQQFAQQATPHQPGYDALASLLLHLDNDYQRVEALCCNMLAKRDQWLPYVLTRHPAALKEHLERSLHHAVLTAMEKVSLTLSNHDKTSLTQLAAYAAQHLSNAKSDICHCINITAFPAVDVAALPQWHGMAELLLTDKHQWRKRIDKKMGFANNDASKAELKALLERFADNEDLRHYLEELRLCPNPQYSEQQWHIIHQLTELLPLLAAELKWIFSQAQITDFIEIATLARLALGQMDAPSDIALQLNHQIQHLLIDEFQDTSISQYQLLTQLTADWTIGDGRTLFLVGDPMQSIYRFRKAEVGLFLRAQHEGIGQILLEKLTLTCNFRATDQLVNWVNHVFANAFPQIEDIGNGAIPYTHARATQPNTIDTQITCYNSTSDTQEAQQIIELIQRSLCEHPQASIGILVRSRKNLLALLPLLEQAHLPYQAVELSPLAQTSIVLDLCSLTRAFLNAADRLAWLSILRAPWCGLTLADLCLLVEPFPKTCIAELIGNTTLVETLSQDGQQRVLKLVSVYAWAQQHFRRISLSNWIERVWHKLAGPTCLEQPEDQLHAQQFFELLLENEQAGTLTNWHQFQQVLNTSFAKATPQTEAKIHVMTMHKAKGLEFDIVILPGLSRSNAVNDSPLLLWQERPSPHGSHDLLLAPMKPATEKSDAIYRYLRFMDQRKTDLENVRLLYVALTRARRQLHLFAQLAEDKQALKAPAKNSLLHAAWSALKADFPNPTVELDAVLNQQHTNVPLKRLPSEYFEINDQPNLVLPSTKQYAIQTWQTPYAKHIGTVIHLQLKLMAEHGIMQWDNARLKAQQKHWQTALRRLGIAKDSLVSAVATISHTCQQVLDDPKAQWILSNTHTDAHNEYALTTRIHGITKQIIIDRTFISEENIRWIIDYKTTSLPENIPEEIFYQHEMKKHHAQLTSYASAMAVMETRPIHLGLYYPLFGGWWEIFDLTDVK